MKWLLAALLTSSCFVSAQAYTCDDVRSLSSVQKAYYIKAFNITPAEQERIRHACYEPKTQRAAAADARTNHLSRSEQDARVVQ